MHLSQEAKEALVLKTINRSESDSLVDIARANNVGLSSLQRWVRNHKNGLPLANKTSKSNKSNKIITAKDLSKSEQFGHVLSAEKLDAVSLGKYCRENGLYAHQISKWREQFMKDDTNKTTKDLKSELKAVKEENKQLQKDLRRKEKALAEASALLIMKKKADLIWGVNEDD